MEPAASHYSEEEKIWDDDLAILYAEILHAEDVEILGNAGNYFNVDLLTLELLKFAVLSAVLSAFLINMHRLLQEDLDVQRSANRFLQDAQGPTVLGIFAEVIKKHASPPSRWANGILYSSTLLALMCTLGSTIAMCWNTQIPSNANAAVRLPGITRWHLKLITHCFHMALFLCVAGVFVPIAVSVSVFQGSGPVSGPHARFEMGIFGLVLNILLLESGMVYSRFYTPMIRHLLEWWGERERFTSSPNVREARTLPSLKTPEFGIGYLNGLLASWERRSLILSQPSTSKKFHAALEDLEVQAGMFLMHILDRRDARHAVRQLQGRNAQFFLDAVQHVLDRGSLPNSKYRSRAQQLMRKLAETHEQLPSSLFISGVNDHDKYPTFAGGFGDIYRASYAGKLVALKRIRTFSTDSTSHRTRFQFCREALVWQGLEHRFILPLIGIDRETFPSSFCMVSPWMKHGTILKYLRDRGRGDMGRLLLEIAQGLDYLHSNNIVHGDLRGTNILISDEGSACLSDFGLATTIYDADSTTGLLASSPNHAGSIRWWAPELFQPTAFGCVRFARTRASDVYAYACVCLEVHTGNPPFSDVTQEVTVILKVIEGERPQRPAGMSEELWGLITAAWAPDFRTRPEILDIILAFPTTSNAVNPVDE